jgi:mono/diheme cytochrome c family protein
MRRTAFVLAVLVSVLGVVALAGCGGEEEASPTPTGTDTTATETTGTETTATETTGTETTETGTAQGDPVAGKEVFTGSAGCTGCHTLADAGSTGTVGPVLDDTKPSYDLVVERVTNGSGAMPPFKDTLSQQQIQDVAAYVSSVAGQ